MSTVRRLKAIVVLMALVLIMFTGQRVRDAWHGLNEPIGNTAVLRFRVSPGARIAHVAADLAAQGVIKQPRIWIWYARYKGLASGIKAGEYALDAGITPRKLLYRLVSGEVLLHSLTIVDGWRVADLLAALRRDPDVLTTLSLAPNDLMRRLGSSGDAEGQFLPETYKFPSGTTDLEILRQAHVALTRELDAAWASRDNSIALRNPYELLTMASIVQKETGVPREIGLVAGLYLHRLKIGMRLQADPTIIYGLGDRYGGSLHTVDLRTDGPYNSYTRTGLPPTPVALAGAAVLRATAHPETTKAIYFVASPKGDGSHVFSETLEQHNVAVTAYLARHQRPTSDAAR